VGSNTWPGQQFLHPELKKNQQGTLDQGTLDQGTLDQGNSNMQ